MPNKTIYVADDDLPVFERAQALAGENLSATIARALRRFVAVAEAGAAGFAEITVKVGNNGTYVNKAFLGRELARRRTRERDAHRMVTQDVYQTAKGRLVLYTRTFPDWYIWMPGWEAEDRPRQRPGRHHGRDVDVDVDAGGGDERAHHRRRREPWWQQRSQRQDWSAWYGDDYRMLVFEGLEDLRPHVAEELYNAVVQALSGEDVEFLDI
jgi:EXLDI family protein